jgi:hypothetical protein
MKKMQFFFNENMLGKLSGFSHMHKRKKKIRVFEIMIFFVFYWKFQRKSGILYRVHTLQCKSMAQY